MHFHLSLLYFEHLYDIIPLEPAIGVISIDTYLHSSTVKKRLLDTSVNRTFIK